jgi:inhibitor of KinA sporulation pathway (predicted exonuclease)
MQGSLSETPGFAACPSLLEGLPHFNVRKWHAGLYSDLPKSLKQTVESLGLDWQSTYHRGIDDVRNVASIVNELLG